MHFRCLCIHILFPMIMYNNSILLELTSCHEEPTAEKNLKFSADLQSGKCKKIFCMNTFCFMWKTELIGALMGVKRFSLFRKVRHQNFHLKYLINKFLVTQIVTETISVTYSIFKRMTKERKPFSGQKQFFGCV